MTSAAGFRSVFLDASYLVALFDSDDARHVRASELLRVARQTRLPLTTCWPVLGEALAVLRRHAGYRPARALASALGGFRIQSPGPQDWEDALAGLERMTKDSTASLVDLVCSILVRNSGPGTVCFSFDADFRALGLTVLD